MITTLALLQVGFNLLMLLGLVRLLRDWLAAKKVRPDRPLFPISGRVPGGSEKSTSSMIARDLKAARKKWLEEAETADEREKRLKSD